MFEKKVTSSTIYHRKAKNPQKIQVGFSGPVGVILPDNHTIKLEPRNCYVP